jgi:hypothetical protein
MGYIILISIIVFVISVFAAFLVGMTKGKKIAQAEYAEDQAIRQKDAQDYQRVKDEIKQGVFKDAENQKAELSSHSDAVDRFNAINGKLSNKPKN